VEKDVPLHSVCTGAINVNIHPNEEPKKRRFIKKWASPSKTSNGLLVRTKIHTKTTNANGL
jgi:hypothetical protein